MKRRKFLAAAAATATVAVAATSATALPARLLEDDAPRLDLVPCDGRVLPIADYLDLFMVMHKPEVFHNAFAFRVPDMRGHALPFDIVTSKQWPVVYAIVAQPGMQMPVGTILPVMLDA